MIRTSVEWPCHEPKQVPAEQEDVARSELGVASLLEGSVRRAGNRVRVTAQLIDARTDKHLWAKSYDRELKDIFAIQSELATEIVHIGLAALLTAAGAELLLTMCCNYPTLGELYKYATYAALGQADALRKQKGRA